MTRVSLSCLAVVLLSLPVPASATTWHVPGDAPTIQAGIDAASPGDTVLVACGTYYEHDILMTTGVCLVSETGEPDCVTIDAQQLGRVLYCDGVGSEACIRGFTLQNGYCAGSEVGAGIMCVNGSSPAISDNVISENEAYHAGAMWVETGSAPLVINNTIGNNTARNHAGGVFVTADAGIPVFTQNEFIWNHADVRGGAAVCARGAVFQYNTISDNTANENGGGLAFEDPHGPDGIIEGNLILRNQAGMQGGGIMCYLCSPDILSNTLVENSAGGLGGGIYMDESSPTIRHNIVVGCVDGAGIYCRWGSNPVIECNDVWDNAEGNYGGGDCPDQTGMNGNISEDPLFCGDENPDQPYTIRADSPCSPDNSSGCGLIGALPVGCEPSVATYRETWSSVKALYR